MRAIASAPEGVAPEPAPHVHTWSAWSFLYPGSALSHGYERRYCECGSFQARRVKDATS